jgi:hypothetical protein
MISNPSLQRDGFNEVEAGHLVRRISDLNAYARHSFQLLVSWFTFFVTVNYASMGWLAGSRKPGPRIVLIASMFIAQNLLGILACLAVRRHLLTADKKILGLEQHVVGSPLRVVADLDNETPMPLGLYSWVIFLMVVALITIIIAWACFPWLI